jgi:hypothetical protein
VAWYKDAKRSPFEHDKLFVREPLNPLNKKCTIMDFMTKANIKDFFGGSNTVSQSYKNVGIGPNKLYDCWEITKQEDDEKPCILARNKLAAYIGLYYYADCRDARLNWMVYETIEGRIYESQM